MDLCKTISPSLLTVYSCKMRSFINPSMGHKERENNTPSVHFCPLERTSVKQMAESERESENCVSLSGTISTVVLVPLASGCCESFGAQV